MEDDITEEQRQIELAGWLHFNRYGEEGWTTYHGANCLEGDEFTEGNTNITQEGLSDD